MFFNTDMQERDHSEARGNINIVHFHKKLVIRKERSQLQGTSVSPWVNTFLLNWWDIEATEEQSGAQFGKIEI